MAEELYAVFADYIDTEEHNFKQSYNSFAAAMTAYNALCEVFCTKDVQGSIIVFDALKNVIIRQLIHNHDRTILL